MEGLWTIGLVTDVEHESDSAELEAGVSRNSPRVLKYVERGVIP
jgi:hypothetical protein